MIRINEKKNLRKISLTHEQAVEYGRKGAYASAQKKRENKAVAKILEKWANQKPTAKEAEKLKEMNLSLESRMSMIVLPLLENVNKGDVKSIQLCIELLQQDKEKELRIQKLEEEINELRLQQEREKLEMQGDLLADKVVINMNVKPIEDK